VERISDLRTFSALEAEWEALLKSAGQRTAYLSHRWIAGWVRFLGKGKRLWILIVKEGGRWIGAAPLVQSDQYWYGIPVRILHFPISLGSGNLRSDFILSERREEALLAIGRYLETSAGDWDRWELSGLPADSPALSPLRHFMEGSSFYPVNWQPQHAFYYLPVSGSFESYLNNKSVRFHKTLRNCENRLGHAGAVSHRTLKGREGLTNGVEILFNLEARSSKAKQKEMIRLEGEIRDFYRHVAEAFGASGDGQIDLLEIDGVAVAVLFSLQIEGVLFLLYTCYDPSVSSVSPGLLLIRKVLENAWSQGVREIDFNGWTPNVLLWAESNRPFVKGNVYSRAFRSRLVRFWESTAPRRQALKRAAAAVGAVSAERLFHQRDRSASDGLKSAPEGKSKDESIDQEGRI
jgi:CelD/BcsL family acetyltransferase involved in cellulose biosynthesis